MASRSTVRFRSTRSRVARIVAASATLVALSGALLLAAAPPASAEATFEVNSTADEPDSNPGDGLCRTSARSCTLRAAVQEANAATGTDIINLPAGVYELTRWGYNEDAARTGDLDITETVTIIGAGRDTTIVDGSQSDRVFDIQPGTAYVRMTGMTLRNGMPLNHGGAIRTPPNNRLVVERVTITDNVTGEMGSGGAIYALGALDITESVIQRNSAFSGGGIVGYGQTTIRTSDIASSNAYAYGSGTDIFEEGLGGNIVNYGWMTLYASDVRYGNARFGGGIVNLGSIYLIQARVTGNSARDGGGLWNARGSASVSRSTFSQNRAREFGGGIMNNGPVTHRGVPYYTSGMLTVTESTLKANSAGAERSAGRGGAIANGKGYNLAPSTRIVNSTISGNSSTSNGGAIYNGGTLALDSTTIVRNSTPLSGGGLFGTGRLVNTIIATNAPDDCSVTVVSDGNNLDGGGYCRLNGPGDLSYRDPLLGPLVRSIAGTETHPPMAGSPAIDAGNATRCQRTDQRGTARPLDGNGDGRMVCDIGAHEFSPSLGGVPRPKLPGVDMGLP